MSSFPVPKPEFSEVWFFLPLQQGSVTGLREEGLHLPPLALPALTALGLAVAAHPEASLFFGIPAKFSHPTGLTALSPHG